MSPRPIPQGRGLMRVQRRIMDITACPDCRAFYVNDHDALISACASVGIEEGKSTGAMLRLYMEGYHNDGHREPD